MEYFPNSSLLKVYQEVELEKIVDNDYAVILIDEIFNFKNQLDQNTYINKKELFLNNYNNLNFYLDSISIIKTIKLPNQLYLVVFIGGSVKIKQGNDNNNDNYEFSQNKKTMYLTIIEFTNEKWHTFNTIPILIFDKTSITYDIIDFLPFCNQKF